MVVGGAGSTEAPLLEVASVGCWGALDGALERSSFELLGAEDGACCLGGSKSG